MSKHQQTGIQGILNDILSSPVAEERRRATSPAERHNGIPASRPTEQIPTRRGRPVGSGRRAQRLREKTTLRIERELIADYRDWSWEARCNLSGLVEKAMADYQRRNRR